MEVLTKCSSGDIFYPRKVIMPSNTLNARTNSGSDAIIQEPSRELEAFQLAFDHLSGIVSCITEEAACKTAYVMLLDLLFTLERRAA
jgi:hypothetical protein